MKISYKLIIIIAIVSLVLSVAAVVIDFSDTGLVQNNASYQFQVGVKVRPKTPGIFQKMRDAVSEWFTKSS